MNTQRSVSLCFLCLCFKDWLQFVAFDLEKLVENWCMIYLYYADLWRRLRHVSQ